MFISNWSAFTQKQWKLQHPCLKWGFMCLEKYNMRVFIKPHHGRYQNQDKRCIHPPRPKVSWRTCLRTKGTKKSNNSDMWKLEIGVRNSQKHSSLISLSSTINSSLIDTMNHESKSAFFVGWNKRKTRPNSQATSTQSNTLPSPNQRLSGHQTTSVHWKEAPQKSECYQFINGYDYKTPPNFLWFATLNLPHVKVSYIYPKIPDTIRAPDQDQWCQRCKELPEGNGHLSIPDSVKTGEVKRLRVCGCQCFKSNPWIHES